MGHPNVAAVGLIGSVSADTIKRCLLELGGSKAIVIYPDANIDRTVDGAVRGINE